MVQFSQLNLLEPKWALREPFDAIFCRNVMIYFDKPTQGHILQRFAPLMKPHGLLFAGHSENFSFASQIFRLRGQTVYELVRRASRRVPNDAAAARQSSWPRRHYFDREFGLAGRQAFAGRVLTSPPRTWC